MAEEAIERINDNFQQKKMKKKTATRTTTVRVREHR